MMYATVYMGKEIMEQEVQKKVDNLQTFSTEIKWEKRSEILKKINDQVKTKLNALTVNANATNVCTSVNAKVTESKKWLLKKWWLKSLLRDEHYIHIKAGELQITDDLKWEKSIKDIDLDNRQHRGLVAWFLTGLIAADESVKGNKDFLQLMDYIDALDKLESEFSQTMETEKTLTKKETRKLRKTLRKDINLDKKEGEFDPLLKVYREWAAAQAESAQSAVNEIREVTQKITTMWLKDSGYTIDWPVTKDWDNFTTSIINADWTVKINDVKFDKDGKAVAGDYSGTKNILAQQYAVTVGTDGKLIATEKTTDTPAPWIDKPNDDSFVEITEESDKKQILDLLTWVTITDWKLYKSPATWNIAFYKITWKADGADFTLYLDKDKKLQSEDSGKLTPAWDESVEVGDYTFTQGTDNNISVEKMVDEEEGAEVDLSWYEETDPMNDKNERKILKEKIQKATAPEVKTKLTEYLAIWDHNEKRHLGQLADDWYKSVANIRLQRWLKLIWDQDTYTDMTNKISSVDGLYGDNTYDSVWSFQTKYNEINVDNQIAVDWKAWIETIPAMNSVLETIS